MCDIVFTRNHTEDDADDGTTKNMSPPGRGGGDIIHCYIRAISVQERGVSEGSTGKRTSGLQFHGT